MLFHLACERSDAVLASDVELGVQYLKIVAAILESYIAARARCSEQLQGCDVGLAQDQLADGFANTTILLLY